MIQICRTSDESAICFRGQAHCPSIKEVGSYFTVLILDTDLCTAKRLMPDDSEIVIQQESDMKEYDTNLGTLTVHTNKRRRTFSKSRNGEDSGHSFQDFIAKIRFMPKCTRKWALITAAAYQIGRGCSTILMTSFLANPILPMNSLVFTLVSEGRFDEFRQLLADGKASVRDHDEYGVSLLHVCKRHLLLKQIQAL